MPALLARTRQVRAATRGLTLVELMIVLIILLSAVSMFAATVASTTEERALRLETSIAADAARAAIERMRNERFSELFALFNADPLDDPRGPGSAPGARFAVPGVDARPGAGGLAGEIVLPVVDTALSPPAHFELREDVVDRALGMPRDLDADNVIDERDHADDYFVLPVRVRVAWVGKAGERELACHTLLVEYERLAP